MYEPGSPSSPLATMKRRSPGALRANSHFVSGREAGAAAAAHGRRLDLREQLLGGHRGERVAQALPVAPAGEQHRPAVEHAARLGLVRRGRGAGEDARDRARPGVDHVAVANRRRAVAEAQADGLGERDLAVRAALAERQPEAVADRVDVAVGGRREARRAGADAHVALRPRGWSRSS